jgi:hypothetical protein
MKKDLTIILLFLVISFVSKVTAQDCLPDGITFSSQEQIDNFPNNYPGCTQILKNVLIKESVAGNITNLDSLYQIIKISGNLVVASNTGLISLSGFKNLKITGGHVYISNNPSLTSMNGLENLSSIGGYLKVRENDSLTSLSGLDNLTSVNMHLFLTNNNNLLSLNGLENLTSVKGDFSVVNNNTLATLNDLKNLTVVRGNVSISNNSSVNSLNGLKNLTSLKGTLKVWKNDSLTSLNGLGNVTSIGGDLDIYDNVSLTSLNGLKNVTSIGGYVKVRGNTSLTNLSSLYNLTSIGGFIDVSDNASLLNQDSLENLENLENLEILIIEEENSREVKNNLYVEGGTWGFVNSVSVNYERLLGSSSPGKFNVYGRVGFGVVIVSPIIFSCSATQTSRGGLVAITMLTGKGKHHFEASGGAFMGYVKHKYTHGATGFFGGGCEQEDDGFRPIPLVDLGYRYQRPEGGFIFRAKVGILGVGISLGTAF